jgi:regulator of sigma E protease
MALTIITGFIVLSILVLTHEFGHFITARWSGVTVEEFGIGFPPRIVSFKRGETIYSINWIFFGGFTKLAGEEDPDKPGALAAKSRKARLLVLSGGSLANLLFALIIFSVGYLFPRPAATGQVTVEQVQQNSPAAVSGIIAGDIILSVNGQLVDSSEQLGRIVTASAGTPVTLDIRHPGMPERNVQVTPRVNPPPGQGAMGIATSTLRRYSPWLALPLGFKELGDTVVAWASGIAGIFTGQSPASFMGPVGIVQLTGEVASKFGFLSLLSISAVISLILAIMNLLPLPAIDGGRITFLLLELVRGGKRVAPKTERIVHLIGFALFMLFFVAITYQDILRIASGTSQIP